MEISTTLGVVHRENLVSYRTYFVANSKPSKRFRKNLSYREKTCQGSRKLRNSLNPFEFRIVHETLSGSAWYHCFQCVLIRGVSSFQKLGEGSIYKIVLEVV